MMKSIASRKAIAARAKNALKIGSCFLSNTTSISKCNNEKNAFLDSIEEVCLCSVKINQDNIVLRNYANHRFFLSR